MSRSVVFIDPPAFCATVESLASPALRHRPIAVAPPGAERATVLALSAEARLAGIVPGMLVLRARKLCPDLVLLPPNPRLYARASRALHEILRVYAPVIEPRGYGHAFLDLTGTARLFGPVLDVAERIRRESLERLGLPLTVGVAGNKLVSEAATRAGRTSANRPQLVEPGGEAGFLAPHLLEVLPGLPLDIRKRLDEYQLERIGMVAAIAESELCAVFGSRGRHLKAQTLGQDSRPVLPPEVRAEFRASHTFATDTNDRDELHRLLRRLSETLGFRLRRRGLAARRLVVEVEYTDYERASRSTVMPPAALDADLWEASQRALGLAATRRVSIRLVSLTVDRLLEANVQLDLWDAGRPAVRPSDRLQNTLDHIHRRWGARAVMAGSAALASRAPESPSQVERTSACR